MNFRLFIVQTGYAQQRSQYRQEYYARLHQGDVGFEELGEATDPPFKSLIRMFWTPWEPAGSKSLSVIGYLQKRAGVQFHVKR
jgi:hypothetical protein